MPEFLGPDKLPAEDERKLETRIWIPDQLPEPELKTFLVAIWSQAMTQGMMLGGGGVDNIENAVEGALQDVTMSDALRKVPFDL